jgi:ferredoxin-thioredoxin reductase catalytic subunit
MAIEQKDPATRMQEAIAKAWHMAEKYALKKGYKLNPDRPALDKLMRSMARRQILYGYRYCP